MNSSSPLVVKQRSLVPHSAVVNPEFGEPTIVASDPWKYVALFLRRNNATRASFYWNQAHEFFVASQVLSTSASPVTSYYSALNAAQAFLTYQEVPFAPWHGVSGSRGRLNNQRPDLRDDMVNLREEGVLPSLAMYLRTKSKEEKLPPQSKSLYDLLYAIPFIHRAFTLTFPAEQELFIPLSAVYFAHDSATHDVRLACNVDSRYDSLYTGLPPEWEWELQGGGSPRNGAQLRLKNGFQWMPNDAPESMKRLKKYHRIARRRVVPIVEQVNRWYLARKASVLDALALPVVMLAALHRFSELSRYDPLRLHAHLEADQNWLIDEFLEQAPAQFIHLIASEITGREFLRPDTVRLHAQRV